MAVIKKTKIAGVGEKMKKRELLYISWGNIISAATVEKSMEVP